MSRTSTRREYLLHAVLLFALLAVVFPRVLTRGYMITPAYILFDTYPWKAYGSSDDFPHGKAVLTWEFLGQFTGWYAVARQAVADGEWPLWNPLEHTGVPLLANYQSACFYPPRLLHFLMDLHVASTICILLKTWLCGFNAYVYGRGVRLNIGASRFLSLGWMLCMYIMTWTFWCEVDVGAWLPLLMLGAEWLLDGRFRRGFYLASLSATLMLLAGHPESAFTASLGAGMYFLLRLLCGLREGRSFFRPAALALGAWAVALLVCAAQILPFLEYLPNSLTLSERAGEAGHALSPQALISFWAPRYYGMTMTPDENYWGYWTNSNFNAIIFPGVTVWIGILLLFSRRDKLRASLVRPMCVAFPAIFCLLVVFNHPVIQPITRIPVIGSMWNIWYIAFPAFALPLLGAMGIERWLSRPRRLVELIPSAVMCCAVTAAIASVYFTFHRPDVLRAGNGMEPFVARQVAIATLAAAVSLVILLLHVAKPRAALCAAMLAVVLAADLLWAGRNLRPTAPRDRVYIDTALTDWLQSIDPPPRCALGSKSSAAIPDGVAQYYGIEDMLGYDGIYPKRFIDFRENVRLWESMEPLVSVRYFLNAVGLQLFVPLDVRDRFQLVATLDNVEVYENTRAWPRVALVPGVRVVEDPREVFAIMSSREFDPRRQALIDSPLPAPPTSTSGDAGEARFVGRTMNTVTVEIDAKQRSILVLADQYFPGWEAIVDGEPAAVFPVYHAFRGVVVEPGLHTVVFRFNPLTFRIGLAVSVIVLLVSCAFAIMTVVRTRVTKAGPSMRSI
jgi:hypothetical protein